MIHSTIKWRLNKLNPTNWKKITEPSLKNYPRLFWYNVLSFAAFPSFSSQEYLPQLCAQVTAWAVHIFTATSCNENRYILQFVQRLRQNDLCPDDRVRGLAQWWAGRCPVHRVQGLAQRWAGRWPDRCVRGEGLLIVGQAVVQQAVHGCLHVHAHDRGQDVRGFAQWWADRCQQRRRTLRESESNDV